MVSTWANSSTYLQPFLSPPRCLADILGECPPFSPIYASTLVGSCQ